MKEIPSQENEVNEILSKVPQESKKALERLRKIIKNTASDAVEVITYGAPGFKYKGRAFVSYNAAKYHCAFYVQSPEVMELFSKELTGFDTSKGTIRFKSDEPLPEGLIQKILRARMKEIDSLTSNN
jgi:uncharacterized protein YdhG (YjbR/CyaY superfamily)